MQKKTFREIFKKTNKQIVFLVDEYDKPIIDNLDKPEIAKEMREELKNFFEIVKSAEELKQIKFIFVTGVTKFLPSYAGFWLQKEIENLNKVYKGGSYAIKNLNLEIPNGMFGLLGPNGAGKTTNSDIIRGVQKSTRTVSR